MDIPSITGKISIAFYKNAIKPSAVAGIEAILLACTKHHVTSKEQIAYVLATAYHEVAATFKPIEEYGKGKGRPYGSKIDVDGKPYSTPDKLYYGRGFVQLTWLFNYKRFSRLLKVDLVNHPELALDLSISAEILVQGMKGGLFTGKKLSSYINEENCDYLSSRKIINGKDKALLIASYASKFFKCL